MKPRPQDAPHGLVRWCLQRLLPAARMEDVLGDLEERAQGRAHPSWWQARETMAFVARLALEGFHQSLEWRRRFKDAPREKTAMLHDLGFAVRTARRKPGFFLLATSTLALAIGANGALFSLMDAVYFRPLPIDEPERLLRIESTSPKAFRGLISYLEYQDIVSSSPALEEVVAVGRRGAMLHQPDGTHILLIDYVSQNFFEAMGIPLQMGQSFLEQETSEKGSPQVIINHQLWQDRLGGREDVIGSAIQLNDTLFTVIGVTPADFIGLDRIVRTDVWVTTAQAAFVVPGLAGELTNRHHRWFEVYGRLAPGASEDEAGAQLKTLASRWEQDEPEEYPRSGFQTTGVGETRQKALRDGMILLALPGLVLLIAGFNVASLMLARDEARRRELAIRAAIGAGRGRLLWQLLSESLVLATVGSAAGLLVAAGMIRLFPFLVPPAAITYTLDARLDLRMLAFCALLLLMTTLLLSTVSASRSTRPDLVRDLKNDGTPSRSRGRRFGAQHFIVGAQTMLGVLVLVAAALMVRSLWLSSRLHPGFDTRRQVATLYLVPGLKGYDKEATHRLFEQWRYRLAALPSVGRVSYAIRLPAQDNEAGWSVDVVVPGVESPPGESAFRIRYTMVGPDYFDVMGTRVLRGRGVTEMDHPDSQPVAIVNEIMAKRFWPHDDPIGKTIRLGGTAQSRKECEIVGVAEDVKISDLYEAPEMYLYVPFAQDQQGFGLLLVETELDPETVLGMARSEIAAVAPDVPVLETGSLAQHMEMVLFEERRDAWLAIGVGLLALGLTTVGLYGLVSMVTSQRTREIGIRVVLGASGGDVLRLVFWRALSPALVGSLAGLAVGLMATRALESRLHGIEANDPVSFALGTAILVLAALVASLFPALRASRLDPASTIRCE